jgi:hypothetical protein
MSKLIYSMLQVKEALLKLNSNKDMSHNLNKIGIKIAEKFNSKYLQKINNKPG